MKVYRISKCRYIDDLSGTGSSLYPGRWHNKGTFVIYTAATPSLAMLECVVHITSLTQPDLCMICLEIPEDSIAEILPENLLQNWFSNPAPEALREIGDAFVRTNSKLALKIPSAVMPEEHNLLLNPAHPLFKKIKVIYTRNLRLDERLQKR